MRAAPAADGALLTRLGTARSEAAIEEALEDVARIHVDRRRVGGEVFERGAVNNSVTTQLTTAPVNGKRYRGWKAGSAAAHAFATRTGVPDALSRTPCGLGCGVGVCTSFSSWRVAGDLFFFPV